MRSEVWLFHLSAQTVFVSSEHHLHSGVFVRLLQQNAVCLLQRRCPPQKDTLFKQTLELLPSSFLMLCPPISESGLQRNPQQSLDICAAFRRVFVADHRHGLQAGLSCQTPALMGGGVLVGGIRIRMEISSCITETRLNCERQQLFKNTRPGEGEQKPANEDVNFSFRKFYSSYPFLFKFFSLLWNILFFTFTIWLKLQKTVKHVWINKEIGQKFLLVFPEGHI